MLQRLLVLLLFSLLPMGTSAINPIFPAVYHYENTVMNKVGEGSQPYLFGEAYRIALWAPQGRYSPYIMHALQIELRTTPPKHMLREALAEELGDMGITPQQVQHWMGELTRIFPMNARKGDTVTIITIPGNYIEVYYNQQPVGRVADQELTHYFSNIWLRADSANPELARRLKGAS